MVARAEMCVMVKMAGKKWERFNWHGHFHTLEGSVQALMDMGT